MEYWIYIILIINILAVIWDPHPLVRLNAAIVSAIALIALGRIFTKKRRKHFEKLQAEFEALQKENVELREKLEKHGIKILRQDDNV